MQAVWSAVDAYFEQRLAPADPVSEAALRANAAAGLPAIDVSPLQGRFLDILVRIAGAKRILEFGTLGGYSTLWLARAAGAGGRVVTLEADADHAAVARANFAAAGIADRIDLRLGLAIDPLPLLEREGAGPFDLVFIDADKAGLPAYLDASLRLSRPGTVIVADNVVRGGKVIQPDSGDANVDGVRRFVDLVGANPRLNATALQTVGAKGHDGFALALVLS
jgi:predicted O-methyltransferase YrrM